MIISKKAIPRRTMLRGIGATIALPLLDAMVPAMTALQKTPARPVRRLGVVYHPNGVIYENWLPNGVGRDFTLSPTLEPLEPFKKKVLIVDGLSIPPHGGEEHPSGRCSLLTGRMVNESGRTWTARGLSFDRYLAGKIGNGVSFYTSITSSLMDDTVISWNAAGSRTMARSPMSAAPE